MSTLGQIFKAYDIRNTYPDKVNEAAAWKIGVGVGRFLKDHPERPKGEHGGAVLVSRDMRASSPSLAEALIEGIRAADMGVIDLGLCDTSFGYFAVNHLDAAGAVQVTASHNPPNYNGFKISGPMAKPIGGDTGLKDIQKIAEAAGDRGSIPATASLREMDLWDDYRGHIHRFLVPLKRKFRVFIDASNGMAGKLVPKAFEGVDNLEIIPLNFEHGPDVEFAHEPNPLKAENMAPTQAGVKSHGADLGACFDGDADRCMLVDDRGEIIGCDHLTALLANHFVAIGQKDPSPGPVTVVYDLRSSKVVEEVIRNLQATPLKSRVGHVFMKAALRESRGVFGGELSGHFYFRDNFYADSGAIAFASVLSVMNAEGDVSLSELVDRYRKYPQSGEINFHAEDKQGVMDGLRKEFTDVAKIDDLDGVTIDAWDNKGWWFNVRASNTEPLLRLNAEAKDQQSLDKLVREITPKLGTPEEAH